MEVKRQILASQISVKRTLKNEKALERELSKFFKRLQKEVLSALEEYWSEYQLLQGQINLMVAPVHEAHREYYEILEKYVRREYKLGQAEAKRNVERLTRKNRVALKATQSMPIHGIIQKGNPKVMNDWFATIPAAERDLLNRTFRASEQTMSRVDNQINNIISDGYKSGKGINDIGSQLTRRFDQLSTWEARRIARTEVNTSHNVATRDTYKDMGVEYTQWIAASDDRTRDSHVEVDGEIIPIEGKYSNGLGYPGDMSGPLEEWINCRCSNAPFVIPFGYMAPSFSPFREEDLIPVETVNPLEPVENEIPTDSLIQSEKTYREINSFHEEYGKANEEHGYIMDIKTGEKYSPTFHGEGSEVVIPESSENGASYVKTENCSFIHNHPKGVYRAFSPNDINVTFRSEKINHCIAVSEKEVWILKTNPSKEGVPVDFIVRDFDKASKKVQFEHANFKFDEKAKLKKKYTGTELSKKIKEFDEYLKSDDYFDIINERMADEYSKVAKVWKQHISFERITAKGLRSRSR